MKWYEIAPHPLRMYERKDYAGGGMQQAHYCECGRVQVINELHVTPDAHVYLITGMDMCRDATEIRPLTLTSFVKAVAVNFARKWYLATIQKAHERGELDAV